MQGVTLAIGIVGSILVLLLRPAYALAAYIGVLIWYPDYLRVSIGTIDISAGRIVVAILLLRCLCDDQLRRRFVWSRLDTLVTLSMVVYVGMYCLMYTPLFGAIENRSGFLIDTWFSYLAVRMCIRGRTDMIAAIKLIAVALAPLAALGVVEAITGWQPFLVLRQYCPWLPEVRTYGVRWGLNRGWGPFSHPIMFGACFVMFLPLIWSLRHQRGYWGRLAYPLSAITVLGGLSSMSSGPWGMLIIVVFCLVLERYKRWTKAVLMWLFVLCILAEIGSNRPLYHVVLQTINLAKGSWYQRAKLIDFAIRDFDEWWLAGYGGRDPGWAEAMGERVTDCNNEFILKAVQYGMLGVIALAATLAMAFRGLVRAFKETTDKELRSLYWAMGCALVGVIVIWQGVSFFGTPAALFYCLLGTIGSSIGLAKYVEPHGRTLQIASSNIPVLMYAGGAERAPADAVRGIDGART